MQEAGGLTEEEMAVFMIQDAIFSDPQS